MVSLLIKVDNQFKKEIIDPIPEQTGFSYDLEVVRSPRLSKPLFTTKLVTFLRFTPAMEVKLKLDIDGVRYR